MENYKSIIKGLENNKTIKIYKRTIEEDKYLVIDNFKIRNDFKDYLLEEINHADNSYTKIYRKKDNDNIISSITFTNSKYNYQLIDLFISDEINIFSKDKNLINAEDKFTSADRKYFLIKNDINNDIDFYKYIENNYYKENNIFMNKRTLMENYAFNLFTFIAIPKIDSITYIKGDYEGFIEKINNTIQVTIIRDNKLYGFLCSGENFQDENYLIDLIGTIEIR